MQEFLARSFCPYRPRCGLSWDPEGGSFAFLLENEEPIPVSEFGLSKEELESAYDDWNEEIISLMLERFFLVGIGDLIVRFRYGPPDLV